MNISFADSYKDNSYILIEGSNKLIEELKLNQCYIKQGNFTNCCVLVSDSSTYELKQIETSNQYTITEKSEASSNDLNIISLLKSAVDSTIIDQNIIYLSKILNEREGLCYYNIKESNINHISALTLKNILEITDYSINFLKANLIKINAFEKEGKILIYENKTKLQLLKELLDINKRLNETNTPLNASNLIQELKYPINENEADVLVDLISDNGCMNKEKIKQCIAEITKNELINKPNSKVIPFEEFKKRFFTNLSLYCSLSLSYDITEEEVNYLDQAKSSTESNLFDYFNLMDLRFLKGKAVVKINSANDYSLVFYDLFAFSPNFQVKLKEVFKIKDLWTVNELSCLFPEEKNIKEKVGRFCKNITDLNPFNGKEITLLKLKFN